MKLLVVLLNYRTPEMTLEALEASHRAIARIPGARIDVVDNDSRDGSFERITRAVRERGYAPARVRVRQTGHNGGFGAGNNFAIREALAGDDPPQYVYIQNSDAFPEPDAIEALVRFMDRRPEVGIAGSELHGIDGAPHVSAFRFPTWVSELESGLGLGVVSTLLARHRVAIAPRPTESREVDWLAGASMIVRAKVLEQVGLFDETFFLYFEETDLCRRAKLAGWPTWYVVESHVTHAGGASTGMNRWRRVPRYWLDSRRHYFRKNHGSAYLHLANVVFAASHGLYKVRARIQGKPPTGPSFFVRDFVRYSFGVPIPEPRGAVEVSAPEVRREGHHREPGAGRAA